MTAAVMLAGGLVGLGLVVLLAWSARPVPDLPATVSGPAGRGAPGTDPLRLLEDLAGRAWLTSRPADLALVGIGRAELATRRLLLGLVGLVFPLLLAVVMAVIGLTLPVVVPAIASLVLAAVLFRVPDLELRTRARQARADLRWSLSVYLELVALERAADAGTVAALERPAAVADARLFVLLREELGRTQLAGRPAWLALESLAERLEVVELRDAADIMRLTGEDGAAVYRTLRARAASLREAMLAEQATAANAASEQMVVPVAMLGLAFLLLLGYPAFARIVYG
jgi:hypothetical protein